MQFALGGWPSTVLVELLWVPGVRASASGPVSECVSARTSVPPPSSSTSSSSSGSRTGREWLLTSRRRRPRPRCRPTVETRPRPSLDRPRRGRPGDNGRTPSAGFVSSFSWPIRFERNGFGPAFRVDWTSGSALRSYRSVLRAFRWPSYAAPGGADSEKSMGVRTPSMVESNSDRIVTLDLRYTV
jgi:hypothetical protein